MQTLNQTDPFGLTSISAVITAITPFGEIREDHRPGIALSKTIMLPETANRLCDVGWIDELPIVHVSKSPCGEAWHHFEMTHHSLAIGQTVKIQVDPLVRRLHSRLLCAGRLIELLGPLICSSLRPVAADFRPNRAYIGFGALETLPSAEFVLTRLGQFIDSTLNQDVPIEITSFEHRRFCKVRFGDLGPSFICNGVYPVNLNAIGRVILSRVVQVGGQLEVRFTVN